jgi:hypothetical protein
MFHYDDLCKLLLRGLFNPIVDSQRGLQLAGELEDVQQRLGVERSCWALFPLPHVVSDRPRPVFDRQSRNLLEMTKVPAKQQGAGREGDACDPEIKGAQATTAWTERREDVLGGFVKHKDVHALKRSPHGVEFPVGTHDSLRLSSFVEISQPSLELFLEADNRGRDIVWRKSI